MVGKEKKPVLDVVNSIQEAIKHLGLEITAFDSGRELFTREDKPEINIRFALPFSINWVSVGTQDKSEQAK